MRTGMRVGAALVMGAVLAASGAGWSSAAVINLNPSKDNTLFQDATGSLSDAKGDGLFAGTNGSGQARRAVLAFDLSAIPAGNTITSATLTLNVSRTVAGTTAIGAHKLLKDWGEGTSLSTGTGGGNGGPATTGDATWIHTFYNTATWTNAGGDFSATTSGTGSASVGVFSITGAGLAADVQAWYASPSTNFGWILIGDEAGFGSAKRFDSRENVTPSLRPLLTVEYAPVPEPTAAAALGLVWAVPAFVRRGRRR